MGETFPHPAVDRQVYKSRAGVDYKYSAKDEMWYNIGDESGEKKSAHSMAFIVFRNLFRLWNISAPFVILYVFFDAVGSPIIKNALTVIAMYLELTLIFVVWIAVNIFLFFSATLFDKPRSK